MARIGAAEIAVLREVQKVTIYPGEGAGVVIWVVVVGNEAFVRSYRGARGRWWAVVSRTGRAELGIGETRVAVQLEAVEDGEAVAAVSAAFARKYAGSSYLAAMMDEGVLATTLRVTASG